MHCPCVFPQSFPHGTVTSVPSGDTMTDKIQHAQADLYSNVADKASDLGESIKGNIASADQTTSSCVRDATAAAATKLNEAGSTAAEAAGGVADQAADMYNRAKETVKVRVLLRRTKTSHQHCSQSTVAAM